MVVLAVAALYGNIVTVGIVNAVKQQDGITHHFETRNAVKGFVEIVSLDFVLTVCKSVLVFAFLTVGQVVLVSRSTRCADRVLYRGVVGIGYGQRCTAFYACPACAAGADVKSCKRCAVLLPQGKQGRVGGKRSTFDIL